MSKLVLTLLYLKDSSKTKDELRSKTGVQSFALGDLDFQSLLLLLCLHLRWNSSSATYGRDFSWLLVLKLNHILANSVRYFVCLLVLFYLVVFFFGKKHL
jgi:hypothetical protein